MFRFCTPFSYKRGTKRIWPNYLHSTRSLPLCFFTVLLFIQPTLEITLKQSSNTVHAYTWENRGTCSLAASVLGSVWNDWYRRYNMYILLRTWHRK